MVASLDHHPSDTIQHQKNSFRTINFQSELLLEVSKCKGDVFYQQLPQFIKLGLLFFGPVPQLCFFQFVDTSVGTHFCNILLIRTTSEMKFWHNLVYICRNRIKTRNWRTSITQFGTQYMTDMEDTMESLFYHSLKRHTTIAQTKRYPITFITD